MANVWERPDNSVNAKERLIMSNKTLAAIAATTFALFASAPAFAGTQEDVAKCRVALTEEGTLNMDDYRLSFKGKRGNSKRTLTLEAIPNNDGAHYMVKCSLKKSKVTGVELAEKA